MRRTLGVIVAIVILSGCSAGEPTDGPQSDRVVTSVDLANHGGCWRQVYASNPDWTEVLDITLTAPSSLVPNESTELQIGDGVVASLASGVNLRNLYCNDVIEGNERTDSKYTASAGSVSVTISDQFPQGDDLGVLTSIGVVVVVNELVFQGGDFETLITDITIDTHIGWLPG